jgi:hypothetical protein
MTGCSRLMRACEVARGVAPSRRRRTGYRCTVSSICVPIRRASSSATPRWTPSTSPVIRSIRNGIIPSPPERRPEAVIFGRRLSLGSSASSRAWKPPHHCAIVSPSCCRWRPREFRRSDRPSGVPHQRTPTAPLGVGPAKTRASVSTRRSWHGQASETVNQ